MAAGSEAQAANFRRSADALRAGFVFRLSTSHICRWLILSTQMVRCRAATSFAQFPFHQAISHSIAYQPRFAGPVHLLDDPGAITDYSGCTQMKLPANLGYGFPGGDRAQHVPLAIGEALV
jgi:hypothetical protein